MEKIPENKQKIFSNEFKAVIGEKLFERLIEIFTNKEVLILDKLSSDIPSKEDLMDYCLMTPELADGMKELNDMASLIIKMRIPKIITPPGGHRIPKGVMTIGGVLATTKQLNFVSMGILTEKFSELLLKELLDARNIINHSNITEGITHPAVASNLLMEAFLQACMEKLWTNIIIEATMHDGENAHVFHDHVKDYLEEFPERMNRSEGVDVNLVPSFGSIATIPHKMQPGDFIEILSHNADDEMATIDNIPLIIEDILNKITSEDFVIADKTYQVTLSNQKEVFIRIKPNSGKEAHLKYENIHRLCMLDIYSDKESYTRDNKNAFMLEFSRYLLDFTLRRSSITLNQFVKEDTEGADIQSKTNYYLLALLYESLDPVEHNNVEEVEKISEDTVVSEENTYIQNEPAKDTQQEKDVITPKTPYEKMPAYACNAVIRALGKVDWVSHVRTRGDHYVFRNKRTGESAVVPNHGRKTLNIGILRKTMKTLEITPSLLKEKT